MSSDQRREQVLGAALREFAEHGYHAAKTSAIAHRVGVSQPYLYALFPDKKALFLACQEQVRERILATFRAAAAYGQPSSARAKALPHASVAGSNRRIAGDASLDRLAASWRALLPDGDLMRCQLQGFAASAADPDIRANVRQGMMDSIDTVVELSGASREQVGDFVARGLLLNIAAILDLPAGYLPASAGWSSRSEGQGEGYDHQD